jgi:hypothetical protein
MENNGGRRQRYRHLRNCRSWAKSMEVKISDESHWLKGIGIVGVVISPDDKRGGHEREK